MFFVVYKDCEFLRFFKAKLIHNWTEFLTKGSDWIIFHTNYNALKFNTIKIKK